MLGRAARRRCPRGLRRGREALLALLALLALAGLASVLRARRGAGAAEPGLRRTQRSGRRDPVLPRPPVPEDALGAHGEAVRLQLQGEELRLQEESVRLHQINIYLSDRISLHRRLPERWNPLCKEKKYNYDELPTT
ncbi:TPA: polypeptide N-acetylgalactosaminyltransferase 12, partial [Bos taurus]